MDQYEQLDRYFNYLNDNYRDENNYVVYLTLDGHEPSEESCSSIDDIYLISYENNISNWIDSCIRISAIEPTIREVLVQYRDLLEKITGKDTDLTKEIKEYLLKSSDNFNIANSIKDPLIEAKKELQIKFWEKLEIELEQLLKKYDLPIEETIKDGTVGEVNPWYSEEIISRFYTTRINYRWYGLMYSLAEIEEIGELFLKVEISADNIYYGLRKQVKPINDKSENYNKLVDKLLVNDYKGSDSDWWLGWKYLYNLNGDVVNMKIINKELAEALIDEEKFDALIESCVDQIRELVDIVFSIENN